MTNQSKPKNPRGTAQIAQQLMDYIQSSPTAFHAVDNACALLDKAGYQKQTFNDETKQSGQFYFIHNESSLIAVSLNAPLSQGFHLVGAHTDSPCLKVKPNATYEQNGFLQLGVEVYGGVLLAPWFDRDLSLAGRVTLSDTQGKRVNRLINFERPIGIIPSLAIHLNRGVNDKNEINKQNHLPPVLDICEDVTDLQTLLLAQLKAQYPKEVFASVLAYELCLYDTQAPAMIGLSQNLLASARLDNLLSCYIALRALLSQQAKTNCIVVLNDHEEVGSSTASGAAGPFLSSILRKICADEQSYRQALSQSVLVSADNAHAVHPNYSEMHEPRHQPKVNKGPVIKINHNQRYATNSETNGLFAQICNEASVPYQQFVVRSDMGCGSTIGPITATELGIRTVDIGVPQLAMHSIRELAGVQDCVYLFQALSTFFNKTDLGLS